ncbi:MAG TPA: hypothetical protein VMW56_23920 [Candidatus Margulisiibacteriota bacterium]|nr:hypothetical protein [Candidatus Margulisiibacteriota bacterium]
MYVRRGAPGDRERAASLLEAALEQFRALGMPGWIRRAESLLSEGKEWVPPVHPGGEPQTGQPPPRPLLGKEGDRQPETRDPGPGTNTFRREGHFWTVAYAGSVVRLKDTKGIEYLRHLLQQPGQEILALDLVTLGRPSPEGKRRSFRSPRTDTDVGLILDPQARSAYAQRLRDLREEQHEADAHNDIGRGERARAEMEMLLAQLRGAVGLGGRDRPAGSNLERARSAVGKRIRLEIQRIRAVHPALGRHLAATVRTGYFCTYDPERDAAVKWEL